LWYRASLETTDAEPIVWTPPAIFFTTKDPGLTAATHVVPNGDTDKTIVVAFDVLLLDVSLFTTALDVSESGIAFVLTEDAETGAFRVVGLPPDPRLPDDDAIRQALLFLPPDQAVADDAPELPPVQEFPSRLAPAFEAWQAAGRPEQAIRFGSGINAWWTGFRRFPLGANVLWIGVAVPASDLLGDVVQRGQIIAAIAACALLLSIGMASRLARNYGAPLEALAQSSRRIGDLHLAEPVAITSHLREIDQLAREQEHMRVTLDAFSRYVPVDLVRRLLDRGEAARIGGTRQYLTILFTDIEGFTGVSEATTPEKLTAHLEEYFEALLEIIRSHRGEVNQLLGDGVVAFWGAPLPDADHAQHAVDAILECRDRLIELNSAWQKRGMPRLPTRFGVATGEVVVGNVGSHSRLAYAAVGDPVNLASRIEGLNRFYGTYLLVSGVTQEAAGEDFEWRHVDGVRAKGKQLPVELHEPLGRVGEVSAEVLAFRDSYETALGAYRERDFVAAIALLDAIPEQFRSHLSVTRLRELAVELDAVPPPEDWDAITTFTEK
jgi:adenylate cyclase